MKRKPADTYAQVVEQIEALRARAEALKKAEVEDVIARIRQAVEIYELTAADLGFGGPGRRGKARAKAGAPVAGKRKKSAPKSRAAKYRDEAGNTWVGRGPRPAWLRAALADGKKLEDFAV